jgi:oligoendopeptidase F
VAAALSPANVPVEVYRTLIAEANRGLPTLYRYFDLRRRMLGLPDMAYYDIYPPVTKLEVKFDLAATRRLVLEAVKPLGPDYQATLARATAARWMHAYPQKGKRSGAYMDPGAYDVHPYLLLNHNDDYEALTTFAHEWGHAMHSVLAARAQPFETANYTIFTAEIASTCNEQLLAAYMENNARTKEEKLFYLDRICELLRGAFYRQTMFAEFELSIHEAAERGEALSGEKFSAIYLDLLKRYHGPGVIIDPAYAIEWAYIPHFYYDFYVYQYATCVSASAYFSDKVLTGGAAERENYLGVLRAGGADYPVEVLKKAGLDMTTPAPYRAVVAKLGRTVDQMEALLG